VENSWRYRRAGEGGLGRAASARLRPRDRHVTLAAILSTTSMGSVRRADGFMIRQLLDTLGEQLTSLAFVISLPMLTPSTDIPLANTNLPI